MKRITILGTGCGKCGTTKRFVRDVLIAQEVPAGLTKVKDLPSSMQFGTISTPAVVIDGQVVHAGGLPSRAEMERRISRRSGDGSGTGAPARSTDPPFGREALNDER